MRIDPSISSYTSGNIYGSVLRAFLFVRDMGTYQQRDVHNIKRDMQHMLRVY
jgi:hypothetical protein